MREAERLSGVVLADFVADLGVRATVLLLRDAISQIWARNPSSTPFPVIIAAAPVEGVSDVEALDALLAAKFPTRVANRILEVLRRRALVFLDTYPAWQARLADEGVAYPEMERRGLHGEFDESGPLKSRFNLTTMSFTEETS